MFRWFKRKKTEIESAAPYAEPVAPEAEALVDSSSQIAPGESEIATEEAEPTPGLQLEAGPPPESIVEAKPPSLAEKTPEAPSEKSFFARLRDRLSKTQEQLTTKLRMAVGLHAKVDEDLLEEIEDILIQADVGAKGARAIVDYVRAENKKRSIADSSAVISLVKEAIAEILSKGQREFSIASPAPMIVLVVGVNGTGKTTTIGKVALQSTRAGKTVVLVAGDTFRAAASEQLDLWSRRTGAGFVAGKEGADPASVCFDALSAAKKDPPDLLLIDTAGRLHTKTYLMNELGKVIRVIQKIYSDAPHETILVLDATTGQNALNQVTTFREVAKITGLIMTKLDGTAKGGILIAIKNAHPDLPIFKIGIGESPEDLRDFNPREFADALFAEGK
jgi:fused signal recognition particle receptor